MQLKEAVLTRRSIRKFNDKEIDVNTIKEIIDLSQYAPSWKNTQTVRYNLIADKELIKKVALSIDFEWNRNIILNANKLMILSTVNNISGYEKDGSPSTSKNSHWQSFDAGIYAYSFVLVAHEYNIGSVIMGIYDEDKLKKIINLADNESISCIIPLGYYDIKPEAPKKKLSDVVLRVK